MAYKFKPSKAVKKRFKVTGTGKLKRRHTLSTHLRSARDAKKKRHLGRPAIVSESHAPRLRKLMGVSKLGPGKTATRRQAKKNEAAAIAAAPAATAA